MASDYQYDLCHNGGCDYANGGWTNGTLKCNEPDHQCKDTYGDCPNPFKEQQLGALYPVDATTEAWKGDREDLYPKGWTKCLCEKVDLLQELCDDRHDRQRRTVWQISIRPSSNSRSRWRR